MTAEYVEISRRVTTTHWIALSLAEPVILEIQHGRPGQKMAARKVLLAFSRENTKPWTWRAEVYGPRIRKDGGEGVGVGGTNSYGGRYSADPPEWLLSIVESEHPDAVTR